MKIKRQHIVIGFLLLFFTAGQVQAQYADFRRPEVFILQDTAGSLTINRILSPEIQKQFVKSESEIPSFAFTRSVIWCKLLIKKQPHEDLYLDVLPKVLNLVVLYSVYDDGTIDSIVGGTLQATKQTENGHALLFELPENAKDYYLKVCTNTRMFIDLRLKTADNLLAQQRDNIIKGLYAGILFMIFIYNLFLFLSSKDRIFFYYLLHLISTVINFLYLSGVGSEYIWGTHTWVNHNIIALMSFGFIFSALFAIKFLDTYHHVPNLHKGMLLVIATLLIIIVVDIAGYHLISVQLLNTFGFIIILYLIFVSVVVRLNGYRPAEVFLAAWVFYFIGIFIQVMQGFSFISTNIFTANGILIGSVFELTLLSLSIGYKINFLKEQMRQAAVNEQKALSEKENLMKEENMRLETLAEEQSKQIQEKNQKLEKQYKEILKKNEEVKKQNEILHKANAQFEEKNRIIEKQHELLVYHKNNLEEIIQERTKELQKAVQQAKEADEIKTSFLRNVSHEIRTPMNAISGFAGLLFNIDQKDHRHKYYVDIINKNTDSLIELIDDIIELSKIQTGALELKTEVFNPRKIFNELHSLFEDRLKEKKKFFVSLKLSLPVNKDLVVSMDSKRLWKILYHLLDNAVKFTDAGFIDFGYKKNEEQQFEIVVKDSGKGIRKEDLQAIFDYFRKTDKEIKRLYSGTGLGLSLVKGLVTIMNGTITVNSLTEEEAEEQNPGTTFTIVFNNVLVK